VNVRRSIIAPLTAFLTAFYVLVLAPAAMAADGVGLAGRVNDKIITFFCFGTIAFFAILVTVLSLIQGKLDAKKDQRRHDLDRFNS
jgi:xanthine/uracil/vitamin C permease (AzgA family)